MGNQNNVQKWFLFWQKVIIILFDKELSFRLQWFLFKLHALKNLELSEFVNYLKKKFQQKENLLWQNLEPFLVKELLMLVEEIVQFNYTLFLVTKIFLQQLVLQYLHNTGIGIL